jgi:hypothetical protein
MVAKPVIPPNIAIFQFIVCGVTGLAVGKKQKMKKEIRKIRAMILIDMPHFPSENLAGGRGSLRRRFERKQPMDTM